MIMTMVKQSAEPGVVCVHVSLVFRSLRMILKETQS